MADKILIVDDDIDTLKLVGLMLERQGYQIAVASNGTLGIQKAAAEKPDLILLDVMMPDMDGYEVTLRLRADPALSHIPIIMFTAKTMVDDKVAGFEAGVDDYLTKPTHPAELTAHVKAVLSRSTKAKVEPTTDRAQVISLFGTRAGLGTTTLALNIGVTLQQRGLNVIVAELNPGRGTIGLSLNISDTSGLTSLLSRSLKDIHLRSVESALVSHKSGVRFLLASFQPQEFDLTQADAQVESIVKNLASMCDSLILDLGATIHPYVRTLMQEADRTIFVVEPVYPSNIIANAVIRELLSAGLIRHRTNLCLITRERTSLGIPWKQVEADLGIDVGGIISPAPELVQQASQAGNPVVLMHKDSLVSDQIRKLTEHVASHLQLA